MLFNNSNVFRSAIVESAALKRKIRSFGIVPNATYFVENGRVFLFDTLMKAVRPLAKGRSAVELRAVVSRMLPSAWLTPIEAVRDWGVVPVPYTLVEMEGAMFIKHVPFDAVIPQLFTVTHGQEALSQLLVGHVIAGDGDFSFQGQSFLSQQRFDAAQFPAPPKIDVTGLPKVPPLFGNPLAGVHYEPGFDLLTEEAFNIISALEAEWCDINSRLICHVYDHADQLWQLASKVNWNKLHVGTPTDDKLRYFINLRDMYPELASLSNRAIYELFESFQQNCGGIGGEAPDRQNEFLFFLLGKLALGANIEGGSPQDVGYFIGYRMLQGATTDPSLDAEIAAQWESYHAALTGLAWKICDVIRFLRQQPYQKRGRRIVTVLDSHFLPPQNVAHPVAA